MPELTVDEVVETYLALRSQKEAIEAETKKELVGIKAKMLKLETWIQTKSDYTGVKSFTTAHGTASITTSDVVSVEDWDAFLAFVKENHAYDMLTTRGVSKKAVSSYINANGAVPDGVNFGIKLGVSVRKGRHLVVVPVIRTV